MKITYLHHFFSSLSKKQQIKFHWPNKTLVCQNYVSYQCQARFINNNYCDLDTVILDISKNRITGAAQLASNAVDPFSLHKSK